MKHYSYNKEFQIAATQFMDALVNDIIVKRNTSEGQRSINVRALYGDRTRIFKSLESPDKTVVLPAIVVSMEGSVRDPQRVSGINDFLLEIPNMQSLADDEYADYYNYFTPIPINIAYKVEIICKYLNDLDQITTSLLAFINPSFSVVSRHPKIEDAVLKNLIVWNGTIANNFPQDVASTDSARYYATMQFTFKTFIFPGSGKQPSMEDKLIRKINFNPEITATDTALALSNFYPVDNAVKFDDFKNLVLLGKIKIPENMDQFVLSAGFSGCWEDIFSLSASAQIALSDVPTDNIDDLTFLSPDGKDLLVFKSEELEDIKNMSIDELLDDYKE